ncbi:MAG: iron transporter [Clostridiales Family XIII bacterium]|nr:iron transporter [Clostridiales Family XIII bacterium]
MKNRKLLALLLMVLLTLFGLAACGGSGSSGSSGSSDSADSESAEEDASGAADVGPGDVAGFEEFPIGDDQELGPLNVAGVYFQPVDMEPAGNSLPASESDFHIEADISALENDLGYGVGSFVPNLTVNYEIADESGAIVSEGAFMPMSASDGPHYGANVSLGGKAGTYNVKFIIENPEAQGYLLHTDKTTGVEGRFWTEPLVAEWDFDFVPREW